MILKICYNLTHIILQEVGNSTFDYHFSFRSSQIFTLSRWKFCRKIWKKIQFICNTDEIIWSTNYLFLDLSALCGNFRSQKWQTKNNNFWISLTGLFDIFRYYTWAINQVCAKTTNYIPLVNIWIHKPILFSLVYQGLLFLCPSETHINHAIKVYFFKLNYLSYNKKCTNKVLFHIKYMKAPITLFSVITAEMEGF